MMQTLVTAIQSLCGVGLVLGISLCLYNAARPRSQETTKRFDYTNANDFETGHRRWARDR
jgi:hypothetical protein